MAAKQRDLHSSKSDNDVTISLVNRKFGTLQVDMIDYMSGLFDPSFRFAIHADGSPAPV